MGSSSSDSATCTVCGKTSQVDAKLGICIECLAGGPGDELALSLLEEAPPSPERTPSTTSIAAGLDWGDYEILSELARGGMGIVYRARHRSLNRVVALKTIHSPLFSSVLAEARFMAEAEAGARLHHPNIVPILDVGTHEGTPFFTMTLIEGSNLAALPSLEISSGGRLAEGNSDANSVPVWGDSLDTLEARIRLLAKVAQAVHFAHDHGILHRDLKPSNILIDRQGEPFVTDFGLAKRLEADAKLTLTGEVVGTPAYMAPELLSGNEGEQTTAIDVYSLGAMLHFILTGRPPFEGRTPLSVLKQVEAADVKFAPELQSSLGNDLITIALKTLEKEPARRYQSAAAFAEDLDCWLTKKPISARPSAWWERLDKWARRRPYAAALAIMSILFVILLVAQFAAGYRQSLREEARVRQVNERIADTLELARIRRADQLLELGDSGKALAFLAANMKDREGRSRSLPLIQSLLESYQMPVPVGQTLFHTNSINEFAFHPDGRRLATAGKDGAVRIFDLTTGKLTTNLLWHSNEVYRVSFSPDGSKLLSGAYDGAARVWSADTGNAISPELRHGTTVMQAYYSPSGEQIVTSGIDCVVRIWRPDGCGGPLLELKHPKSEFAIHIARFIPGSEKMLTGSVKGTIWIWDLKSGQTIRTFKTGVNYMSDALFSPDAKHMTILTSGKPSLWQTDNWERTRWLDHGTDVWTAIFSQDGNSLVTLGATDIVFWDLQTGAHSRTRSGVIAPVSFARRLGLKDAFAFFDHSSVHTSQTTSFTSVFPSISTSESIQQIVTDPYRNRVAIETHTHSVSVWEWKEQASQQAIYRSRPGAKKDRFTFGQSKSGSPFLLIGDAKASPTKVTISPDGISETKLAPHELQSQFVHCWPKQQKVAMLTSKQMVTLVDLINERTEATRIGISLDCVNVSPNGRWLVGENHLTGTLWVYDLINQPQHEKSLEIGRKFVDTTFDASGKRLVGGFDLGGLALWDTSNWTLLDQIAEPWGSTAALAASPKESLVASGSRDGILRVYSVDSKLDLKWQAQAPGSIESILFTPNGTQIITGGIGGKIMIWDVDTGVLVDDSMSHDARVQHFALSPNGRILLVVSSDYQYRFWDLEYRGPITPLQPWHGAPASEQNRRGTSGSVAMSHDGRFYAVATADYSIELRPVPTPLDIPTVPDWFSTFVESMGGVRLGRHDRVETIATSERATTLEELRARTPNSELETWVHSVMGVNEKISK